MGPKAYSFTGLTIQVNLPIYCQSEFLTRNIAKAIKAMCGNLCRVVAMSTVHACCEYQILI